MGEIFDTLSRIMATRMKRRQKMRLIGAILVPRGFRLRPTGRHKLPLDIPQLDIHKSTQKLRWSYFALDSYTYRNEVFRTFLYLRKATGKELQGIFEELIVDIEKHGADGIETLILAIADGLASRGDDQIKQHARAVLASMAKNLRFVNKAIPSNLKIPLGRVSSVLVLDVRADVMRVLLLELMGQSLNNPNVLSILDLLETEGTREKLCNMPSLQNQRGETSIADRQRKDNCDDHGAAGAANGGTVGGALGELNMSGCHLLHAEELALLQARSRAWERCQEKIAAEDGGRPVPIEGEEYAYEPSLPRPGGDRPTFILGPHWDWAFRGAEKLPSASQRELDASDEYMRSLDEYFAAQDARVAAEHELAEAARQLDQAEKDLKDAEKDLAAALDNERDVANNPDATPEEQRAAQAAAQKANANRDKAQQNKDEKQKKKDEAQKKVDEKKKDEKQKLDDVKKAEEDVESERLEPNDPFNDPDCRLAITGRTEDPALRHKLAVDWAEFLKLIKTNPSPDENPTGSSYESWQLPLCGLDDATVNNRAERCRVPVDCPDPYTLGDENCGCQGKPTNLGKFIANSAVEACVAVNCPDGTTAKAQGMVCVCQPLSEEGNLPLPPGPKPIVISALFGNRKSMVTGMDSPTFIAVRELFQNLSSIGP